MAESSKSMSGKSMSSRAMRAWDASDPMAAAVGYVVTILAVFGFFKWLGLGPDEVATLGGAVGGLVATLRALHERGRRRDVAILMERLRELEAWNAAREKEAEVPKAPST